MLSSISLKQVVWTLDQNAAKYYDEHLTKSNHCCYFKLIKILLNNLEKDFAGSKSGKLHFKSFIWTRRPLFLNNFFKQICWPFPKEIVNALLHACKSPQNERKDNAKKWAFGKEEIWVKFWTTLFANTAKFAFVHYSEVYTPNTHIVSENKHFDIKAWRYTYNEK